MADDWRIRECANQLLLCVAVQARAAMADGPHSPITCPEPMLPASDVLPDLVAAVAGNPRELDRVRRIGDSLDWSGAVTRDPPWRIGRLVTWWLEAGAAVAAWRRSLEGVDGSPATASTSRGGRPSTEKVLLDAVIRRLRHEDYGVYPPCWCADHAADWRLAPSSDAPPPRAWDVVGGRPVDFVAALMRWCGHPRREPGPSLAGPENEARVDGWAVHYRARYVGFAKACHQLIRSPCRFGRADGFMTRAVDWRVFHGSESPDRIRVLRPPVHNGTGATSRVITVGWVMTPWPATLVDQLDREVGGAAAGGWLTRAITRARGWGAEETVFGPVLPPHEAGELQQATGPGGECDRLAALASLVTAVELSAPAGHPQAAPTEPADLSVHDRIRCVLRLEGIAARWTPAAPGGRSRQIPLGACSLPVGPAAVLAIAQADTGRDVVVGEVAGPAACGDDLLAAIEVLDWRWWALRTLRDAGRRDATFDTLVAAADECGWESLKRGLLAADPATSAGRAAAADAHRSLHAARLRLGQRLEGQPPGGIACRTVDGIAGLEAAICAALVEPDRDGVAPLDPPRTRDNAIAVAAWLGGSGGSGTARLHWRRSPLPFGAVVGETLADDGRIMVTLSAGEQVADDDLRLLMLAGAPPGVDGPADRAVGAPLRGWLVSAVTGAMPPDVGAAIAGIRRGFGGERTEAFDRLVAAAVAGDAGASDWIRLMHADRRFDFACHPPVDADATGVRVRAVAVRDTLEWRDDDSVAAGGDLEIRFAVAPAAARRLLSRGRPASDSAEARVARIEAAVRDGGDAFAAAAAAVREAVDRRRQFGAEAADPIGAVLDLANLLAVRSPDGLPEAAAAAAFADLAAWCDAAGFRLVPREWHPCRGAAAAGLEPERVGFHPTVPDGSIVVERFGATAGDGTTVASLEAFVSAGPAPEGFAEVEDLARSLGDDEEAVARLRRCVLEFPRRVRAGQVATAAAGLFDVAWKAVMAAPDRDDLRRAAAAVHRLLDRSYDMVTFEPKTVGEYQDSWLRTREGGTPRGLRVDRLLRPGLRTLDNKLVWPALVEMR